MAQVYKQIALVHPNNVMPSEAQLHLLVERIYTTEDSKQVGRALMRAYPIGDYAVPDHSTYGKPRSSFYEGDHGNNGLPLLSEGMSLTQRAISQGDTLGNMI